MPKKKGGNKKCKPNASLGRALVRRKVKDVRAQRAALRSKTHISNADAAQEAGSRGIQSVTESTSLEDFMVNAVMADRQFVAEKQNVVIIDETPQAVRGGPALAPADFVEPLQIPRRPKWQEGMTAEELHAQENHSFLEWRRNVAIKEETMNHVAVTPFEKSLAFWRQLWRVVERSDVVIQIVDARNPLLFRCPDVEAYVKEVNPEKQCLLLINKADYLNAELRREWAEHFTKEGIDFVFFSAKAEQAKIDEESKRQHMASQLDSSGVMLSAFDAHLAQLEEEHAMDPAATQLRLGPGAAIRAGIDMEADDEEDKASVGVTETSVGSGTAAKAVDPLERLKMDRAMIAEGDEGSDADDSDADSDATHDSALDDPLTKASRVLGREKLLEALAHRYGFLRDVETAGHITSTKRRIMSEREEALRKAKQAAEEEEAVSFEELKKRQYEQINAAVMAGSEGGVTLGADGMLRRAGQNLSEREATNMEAVAADLNRPKLVIGTVGYPNVGKSSLINVLMGVSKYTHGKRVAVSSTAGKTKHFQTMELNDDIRLCDCPGLVFPSFISTTAEMVVNGVLPLDQLRDHMGPMALVASRVPRKVLEATYGIKIPWRRSDPSKEHASAKNVLDSYCEGRSLMAATHSGFNHPAASRMILKDFVNGKLVYAQPPPGSKGAAYATSRKAEEKGVTHAKVSQVVQPKPRATVDMRKQRYGSSGQWNYGDNVLADAYAPGEGPDDILEESGEDEEDEKSTGGGGGGGGGDDSEDEVTKLRAKLQQSKEAVLRHEAGEDDDEDEEEETDEDTDGEEYIGRQPRIRGLGKRRLRKGERPKDPYGCHEASDEDLVHTSDEKAEEETDSDTSGDEQ